MKHFLVVTACGRIPSTIILAETSTEAKEIWQEIHDPAGTDWEWVMEVREVDPQNYPDIEIEEI